MRESLIVIMKIVMAIVAGAVVGWERASKRHSAGLRTFMVVTLSTAVVMMLEVYLHETYGAGFFILSAAAVIAVRMRVTASGTETSAVSIWMSGAMAASSVGHRL